MYIGAVKEFTLKGCYTHSSIVGHTVKSRAYKNYILYNRISSEQGSTSYEIDLPNGGTSYIIGNLIEQGSNSQNPAIVTFGEEGLASHDSTLYVVNNTIVNDRNNGTFIVVSGSQKPARIVNNLFVGPGTLYSGPIDTSRNFVTNSPAFVNTSNYDYRPTSATPGIDKGIDPGSGNGFSLTPSLQYINPLSTQSRTIVNSLIDAGAYEYSAASVSLDRMKLLKLSEKKSSTIWYTINGRVIGEMEIARYMGGTLPVLLIDSHGRKSIWCRR